MNDLEISYNNAPALFKYADDSTMVSPVSNQCDASVNLVAKFMTGSKENNMSYNPGRKNIKNVSSEVKKTILDITPYLTFLNAVVLFYWGLRSRVIVSLPVYEASEPDLNITQNFLDRCRKRRFISYPVSIKYLLKKQDCTIVRK